MRLLALASCALSLNGLVAPVALAADPVTSPPMSTPLAAARAAAQAPAPSARPASPSARAAGKRASATLADTTPPVITSFGLPASVTVTRLGQTMPFTFKGSDDGVGLSWIYAVILSPSGQQQIEVFHQVWGELQSDRKVGYALPNNLEPGIWQLQSVQSCDLNVNCSTLSGDALQSLKGRHAIEVKNAFYDATPPTLAQGVLTLTRLAGLRGMVAADVVALDAGNPRTAGAVSARVELCNPEATRCFTLDGYNPLPDQSEARLRAGAWFGDELPAGLYHLRTVMVGDFNGNWRTYTSTVFGGETDFTGLFNVTSLSL